MVQSPNIDELAADLRHGIALISRRLMQTPAPGALTLPERAALSRLDRSGPASSAELARAEQITPQAMGMTLGALESRGFVERRKDPDDGRRIIMSLTPSGGEILRHKRDERIRQIAKILTEEFTAAELKALAAAAPLIKRLGDNI
jgi:DNA-binding MarR family transcriptional regulator